MEQHEDQQRCQIENEMILNRQPVVVLKQILRSNIGMRSRKQEETNEDHVEKNGSIPQDATGIYRIKNKNTLIILKILQLLQKN